MAILFTATNEKAFFFIVAFYECIELRSKITTLSVILGMSGNRGHGVHVHSWFEGFEFYTRLHLQLPPRKLQRYSVWFSSFVGECRAPALARELLMPSPSATFQISP